MFMRRVRTDGGCVVAFSRLDGRRENGAGPTPGRRGTDMSDEILARREGDG